VCGLVGVFSKHEVFGCPAWIWSDDTKLNYFNFSWTTQNSVE
jgi:hypothetical protein